MKSFRKEIWLIFLIVCLLTAVQIWGSHKALDVRLYYSAIEAQNFFADLSASEVNAYIRHELIDWVYVFVYSYLLYLLTKRFYPTSRILTRVALLPGVFDLIETSSILAVLVGWMQSPVWLGSATFLKWIASAFVLLAILFGWSRKFFFKFKK